MLIIKIPLAKFCAEWNQGLNFWVLNSRIATSGSSEELNLLEFKTLWSSSDYSSKCKQTETHIGESRNDNHPLIKQPLLFTGV
ncbi:hypothetical protein HAX54_026293 [Datura stramonium]|uniref:Uncharacterized protein n=1 Tax=Datura stramonium TaxID=4076 RepID=A0ABS8V3P5_DATST|nr:hypothetical protein [Datura stramonium]